MCPDRDLVSAYVDGEVPSPWRERLEEHFVICPACAALVASYRALGERLRGDPAGDAAASETAALARGRERLDSLLAARADLARPSSDRARPAFSWRGNLSVPLPLAAAAAIFAILLGGAGALVAFKPASDGSQAIRAVASSELAPRQSAQAASMDELLRYLNAQGGEATLTIKLPNETTFGPAGKPVIMRSSAMRATPVGGSAP